MKPLLIACLCLIPWLTSACKPSTQNMPQQSSLSHNQAVDIQNDISRLHNLSQRQNQESAIFQQEALPAIRSGNSLQIAQIIEDMQQRADEIAKIALRTNAKKAMIGGAPFFMGYLETALKSVGIQPLYAFSQRVSVETTAEDGTVTKQNVFKHMGFVEV